MLNKKMVVLIVAGALAGCLALAGCGGSQAASSSAASASAAASSAAAAPAASESAAAASAAPAASESAAAASAAPAASAAAPAASAAAPAASAAAPAASAAATTADGYIGEEAAKDIALKDAGFAAGDVTALSAELDLDDAVVHYDVDFKQGGMDYEYDIDATSGAIITSNSEVDD